MPQLNAKKLKQCKVEVLASFSLGLRCEAFFFLLSLTEHAKNNSSAQKLTTRRMVPGHFVHS